LSQAFFEFDKLFEIASAPIPHMLLPRFTTAKRKILRALDNMLDEYDKLSVDALAPPPLVAKMREALGSSGLSNWCMH
jgi:hypothetical protein